MQNSNNTSIKPVKTWNYLIIDPRGPDRKIPTYFTNSKWARKLHNYFSQHSAVYLYNIIKDKISNKPRSVQFQGGSEVNAISRHCVWGCVCVCVCVCAFALLILPRTFIWQHHDTPRTLHLPRTQKWVLGKHWLKTQKTSCFTILGGSALWGPQWTSNLAIYMRTYESSEV